MAVFGFSRSADGFALAISMSLIVFVVTCAHFFLSRLDKAASKTAFNGAIQFLYKELVIMGVNSFILTLLSSAGLSLGTWLIYLQIADVALFMSTIFHVLFSVALIFANGHYMKEIREDLAIDMHKLVRRYREAVDGGMLTPWTPFSKLRRQIELRVLRITFLSNYNLSRSFDFGRYITIAEENNIIQMLQVSAWEWVIFLIILVSVCVGFTLEPTDRYDFFLGDQCRGFENADAFITVSLFESPMPVLRLIYRIVQCKRSWYQSFMFTCSTGLMLLFTIGLAAASRCYTIRLIKQSGCEMNELDKFVLDDEMADLNEEQHDRISYKELKKAIEKSKLSEKAKEMKEENTAPRSHLWNKASLIKTLIKLNPGENIAQNDNNRRLSSTSQGTSGVLQGNPRSPEKSLVRGRRQESRNDVRRQSLQPDSSKSTGVDDKTRKFSVTSVETVSQPYTPSSIIDASSIKMNANIPVFSEKFEARRKESQALAMRRLQLLHAGIKSGVFLFDSPGLYFLLRDTSLLLLCLFMSFFLITFVDTAAKTNDTEIFIVVPLITLLLALLFQVYTIKSSSMIFSFYKLDEEILGRVVEEKEEIENIAKLLREKLLNKITNAASGDQEGAEVALLQLFNEIQSLDGEADGYISPSELRVLLQRLNIHFTKKRFDDAFSVMDTSADGYITLMEFHAFIFPSDASEKKRLARIQKMADIGHMEIPEEIKATMPRSTMGPKARGIDRLQSRRSGLRNIHSTAQFSPKKYTVDDSMKPGKQVRRSLIKFLQRPSLLLRGNGSSKGNDKLTPVNSDESLPGSVKNHVPITLAQMRDIESGDAWGEIFQTSSVVKPSELLSRKFDPDDGEGSDDENDEEDGGDRDQRNESNCRVPRYFNVGPPSQDILHTTDDKIEKFRMPSSLSYDDNDPYPVGTTLPILEEGATQHNSSNCDQTLRITDNLCPSSDNDRIAEFRSNETHDINLSGSDTVVNFRSNESNESIESNYFQDTAT